MSYARLPLLNLWLIELRHCPNLKTGEQINRENLILQFRLAASAKVRPLGVCRVMPFPRIPPLRQSHSLNFASRFEV